jgi:hypothetical protein
MKKKKELPELHRVDMTQVSTLTDEQKALEQQYALEYEQAMNEAQIEMLRQIEAGTYDPDDWK